MNIQTKCRLAGILKDLNLHSVKSILAFCNFCMYMHECNTDLKQCKDYILCAIYLSQNPNVKEIYAVKLSVFIHLHDLSFVMFFIFYFQNFHTDIVLQYMSCL